MFWIVALVALAGIVAGLWAAGRFGFVGEPPLPGPLAALQQHLRREGIDTDARLVQRGRWADLRQHARFQPRGHDQAFFVLWCASPEVAQKHLQMLRSAASPSSPAANGELVIYLTDWPPDAMLTRQVLGAFARFDAGAPPRQP